MEALEGKLKLMEKCVGGRKSALHPHVFCCLEKILSCHKVSFKSQDSCCQRDFHFILNRCFPNTLSMSLPTETLSVDIIKPYNLSYLLPD